MLAPADLVDAIGFAPIHYSTALASCAERQGERRGRAALALARCARHALGYFFVPKSTRGVACSCGVMSKAAIGWAEEYITERQIRPGNVVSSVL